MLFIQGAHITKVVIQGDPADILLFVAIIDGTTSQEQSHTNKTDG